MPVRRPMVRSRSGVSVSQPSRTGQEDRPSAFDATTTGAARLRYAHSSFLAKHANEAKEDPVDIFSRPLLSSSDP